MKIKFLRKCIKHPLKIKMIIYLLNNSIKKQSNRSRMKFWQKNKSTDRKKRSKSSSFSNKLICKFSKGSWNLFKCKMNSLILKIKQKKHWLRNKIIKTCSKQGRNRSKPITCCKWRRLKQNYKVKIPLTSNMMSS